MKITNSRIKLWLLEPLKLNLRDFINQFYQNTSKFTFFVKKESNLADYFGQNSKMNEKSG